VGGGQRMLTNIYRHTPNRGSGEGRKLERNPEKGNGKPPLGEWQTTSE